mgnify:CR=1 FL=1
MSGEIYIKANQQHNYSTWFQHQMAGSVNITYGRVGECLLERGKRGWINVCGTMGGNVHGTVVKE